MRPPVTVSTYQSQEACEEIRTGKIQQADRSQRPVPPLSCVSKYQGWRRLLYVLEATMATRATTPAPNGR